MHCKYKPWKALPDFPSVEKEMMSQVVVLLLHAGKLIHDLGEDFEAKIKAQERKTEDAVSEGETIF